MKFTFVSHGCLLVESHGKRIVTDPWLVGPCYFTSFWHFPPPCYTVSTLPKIDYIYITHEHPDHFHAESLQQFDRSMPMLVSKFMLDRFAPKLRGLGFQNITELHHGQRFELAPGFTLVPYQVRADDSALIVEDEQATLLNMNDCIIKKRELGHILRRHPEIDFLFKRYVDGDPYPFCYESEEGEDLGHWDPAEIIDQFVETADLIRPRYIIPFASMAIYLTDEAKGFNTHIIPPQAALDALNQAGVPVEAIIMSPGDSWSSTEGFQINQVSAYENKAQKLQTLLNTHRAEIEGRLQAERPAPHLFSDFERYFRGFFRRCPFIFKRRLNPLRVYFDISDLGQYWVLDFRSEGIENHSSADADYDAKIRVTSFLLDQVINHQAGWISLITSLRFRVWLKAGARAKEAYLWVYLVLDDLGYLQLWRLLRPRALAVAFSRRHEFSGYLKDILAGTFLKEQVENKYADE